MIDALRLTGLLDKVNRLKNGLDTLCTEELFSKGEFQLLSIARAIVKNPKLLLLDEITANLDSKTEEMIMKAIREASRNRTVISVSHRLFSRESNVRYIDL